MGNNDYKVDWRGVIFVVCWVVVVTLIVLSMVGCVSQREYRESVRSDTVYVAKSELRVDSVYVDRYRNVYVSGDTVHDVLTEYLTRYVYRDRVDTVYKMSDERLAMSDERLAMSECERSGYDRFCSIWFWVTVGLILVWVVVKVIKLIKG